MDTPLHISKIKEYPADPTTHKELDINLTQAIRNDVPSTLYLHNTYQTDDESSPHLTAPKSECIPFFYGLPKVHKPNIPL